MHLNDGRTEYCKFFDGETKGLICEVTLTVAGGAGNPGISRARDAQRRFSDYMSWNSYSLDPG